MMRLLISRMHGERDGRGKRHQKKLIWFESRWRNQNLEIFTKSSAVDGNGEGTSISRRYDIAQIFLKASAGDERNATKEMKW